MSPSDSSSDDRGEQPPVRAAVADLPPIPRYRRRPGEFYALWFFALLTYGVGDVATTAVAVFDRPGMIESNPVLAGVLGSFGLNGFLAIKLAVFLVLLWISVRGTRTDDRFTYYWPPVATAVVGAVLTAWNGHLLLTAG